MTRVSVLALDDQVAAIVRDAGPVPIGTHDVGRAMGPYRPHFRRTIHCSCGHMHLHEEEARYTRSYHPADVVRPALKRLQRKGLVDRMRGQGLRGGGNSYGHDYWYWTEGQNTEVSNGGA